MGVCFFQGESSHSSECELLDLILWIFIAEKRPSKWLHVCIRRYHKRLVLRCNAFELRLTGFLIGYFNKLIRVRAAAQVTPSVINNVFDFVIHTQSALLIQGLSSLGLSLTLSVAWLRSKFTLGLC